MVQGLDCDIEIQNEQCDLQRLQKYLEEIVYYQWSDMILESFEKIYHIESNNLDDAQSKEECFDSVSTVKTFVFF